MRSASFASIVLCLLCYIETAETTTVASFNGFTRRSLVTRGGNADVNTKLFRRFAEDNSMPSLFDPDEDAFDKYAACLAATEGLRRIRDRDLVQEKELQKRGVAKRPLPQAEKVITAKYAQNCGRVLKALGMSVGRFNELGKTISTDDSLKQRVLEQAYLYRMAATVQMDRSSLAEDEKSAKLLKAVPKDKIQMFCKSMTEIEKLRASQIERLNRSLHVDKFPANVNISDPSLMPFLSPKVRAVVQAFPLQAEEIVKKYGLQSDEFNKMLHETQSNPVFRWKIQKQIKAGVKAQAPAQPQADSS